MTDFDDEIKVFDDISTHASTSNNQNTPKNEKNYFILLEFFTLFLL